MEKPIHFFNFDPRFCGSTEKMRKVTVDDKRVTCPRCASNRDKRGE